MNMRTKIMLRLMPLLAPRISPLRALDLCKYLYLKRLLNLHGIETVLDVGGNVGQFARALRRMSYRGRIISFEPQARTYDKLAAAARPDPNWQVYNYALGSVSGRSEINLMASHSMSSFHEPSVAGTDTFAALNTVVGKQDVEVKRLDEVASSLGLSDNLDRCLLKSDTQGFDLEVLKGAGDMLPKMRLLLLELSTIGLYKDAPSMSDMLTYLDQRGFAPISFFPASVLPDGSVPEFDYLGINRAIAQG